MLLFNRPIVLIEQLACAVRHGGRWIINSLPINAAYTLTEGGAEDYTTTYNRSADGNTGTLTEDSTTIEVVNRLGSVPATGLDDVSPGQIAALLPLALLGLALLVPRQKHPPRRGRHIAR